MGYDDPECTYKVYKEGLMSKVPGLTEKNIFPDNPDISGKSVSRLDECDAYSPGTLHLILINFSRFNSQRLLDRNIPLILIKCILVFSILKIISWTCFIYFQVIIQAYMYVLFLLVSIYSICAKHTLDE